MYVVVEMFSFQGTELVDMKFYYSYFLVYLLCYNYYNLYHIVTMVMELYRYV